MSIVTYGNKTIVYTMQRAKRRTLAITVKPDLSVHVRAPLDAEDEAITRVVKKRAVWVLRQQRFFSQFLPKTPPRQYVSGETHLYLGRQYRLRVREAENESVKLIGGYLYVHLMAPCDCDRIKLLLNEWYVIHARERFQERLLLCQKQSGVHGLAFAGIRVQAMTKRWGSCSSAGILTLNVDLVRAPRACIDYVITHELCHLRHPDHSPSFYKLLASVMPDWQERKLRLERALA